MRQSELIYNLYPTSILICCMHSKRQVVSVPLISGAAHSTSRGIVMIFRGVFGDWGYSLLTIIQMCSEIIWGRVLNGEHYAQKLQKLIYLHLFTDCFMNFIYMYLFNRTLLKVDQCYSFNWHCLIWRHKKWEFNQNLWKKYLMTSK